MAKEMSKASWPELTGLLPTTLALYPFPWRRECKWMKGHL
jgi:hypothetical protein